MKYLETLLKKIFNTKMNHREYLKTIIQHTELKELLKMTISNAKEKYISLLTNSFDSIQVINKNIERARENGMEISQNKTTYMKLREEERRSAKFSRNFLLNLYGNDCRTHTKRTDETEDH